MKSVSALFVVLAVFAVTAAQAEHTPMGRPMTTVQVPDLAKGDVSGTWKVNGPSGGAGGKEIAVHMTLDAKTEKVKLNNGKEVSFFPFKDYLKTLKEVEAQGAPVPSVERVSMGMLVEEENGTYYLTEVYTESGAFRTSRAKILEHTGNVLVLGVDDEGKIKVRFEKIANAD